MKKIFSILALGILLSSCADNKVIEGRTYEPYGWGNYQVYKNDSIIYEPVIGNIVWSVLLVETVVAPIYFTGWSIMEPVKMKPEYIKREVIQDSLYSKQYFKVK